MRKSQAFAAFRQSLCTELTAAYLNNLVPQFNAECEDIRREHASTVEEANEAKSENAKNKLIELAEANKRARIMDLNVRKNEFVQSLRTRLKLEQDQRIEEYGGIVGTKEGEKGKFVAFSDGSEAKVARDLWIDYKLLQRV